MVVAPASSYVFCRSLKVRYQLLLPVIIWSQWKLDSLDWIQALNRSFGLWNKGHVMSTTLALVSSLGLVYYCPQNNPPHCSKKRVSRTTALSSVHKKDEAFAPGVSLWSRSRKEGEVKMLKPSVLLSLLYKISQRTEGTAFCCGDLVSCTMVIKSMQAIRRGVKTVSAFLHLPARAVPFGQDA